MSTDFTIPAIPTIHKGRLYRSRLEARWAAFFDALKWRYEYEPFDLPDWIPDFLIYGKHAPVLVEVKPFTSLEQFDVGKIENALRGTTYWGTEILLLGVAPTCEGSEWSSGPCVGWLGQFMEAEYQTPESYCFALAPLTDPPGFNHEYQDFRDRISGLRDLMKMEEEKAALLWAEAGNLTQ